MTPKELITDKMIEAEAARLYQFQDMGSAACRGSFLEGAKWAQDFLSTHTREVAEKAFEAGADRTWAEHFGAVPNQYPDKETYLNSLNPEGK